MFAKKYTLANRLKVMVSDEIKAYMKVVIKNSITFGWAQMINLIIMLVDISFRF